MAHAHTCNTQAHAYLVFTSHHVPQHSCHKSSSSLLITPFSPPSISKQSHIHLSFSLRNSSNKKMFLSNTELLNSTNLPIPSPSPVFFNYTAPDGTLLNATILSPAPPPPPDSLTDWSTIIFLACLFGIPLASFILLCIFSGFRDSWYKKNAKRLAEGSTRWQKEHKEECWMSKHLRARKEKKGGKGKRQELLYHVFGDENAVFGFGGGCFFFSPKIPFPPSTRYD